MNKIPNNIKNVTSKAVQFTYLMYQWLLYVYWYSKISFVYDTLLILYHTLPLFEETLPEAGVIYFHMKPYEHFADDNVGTEVLNQLRAK